jgi:hypothetical protein
VPPPAGSKRRVTSARRIADEAGGAMWPDVDAKRLC